MPTRFYAVLVGLAAVACADGDPATNDGWAGSIEERDGVTWVLNPADDPTDPITVRFELEQTFGADAEPEDAMIQLPIGVAVDDAGTVYLLDAGRDTRLLAFDKDGELLWTAGSPGEGPGQFNRPTAIAWNGSEGLYVSNDTGARVDLWSTDGVHRGSKALNDLGIARSFVAGGTEERLVLWYSARDAGDAALVHVVDTTGEWEKRAEFIALGGRTADDLPDGEPGGVPDVSLRGDRLWVGNVYEYVLREYDLDGRLLRVVAREHPRLLPSLVYRGTGLSFGSFDAPEWLADGHGLVIRSRVSNVESADEVRRLWDEHLAEGRSIYDPFEYEVAVDVIDSTGRILGSVPLAAPIQDQIGWPALIGPDGRLYTRAMDPYPQVRRYRIELGRAPE